MRIVNETPDPSVVKQVICRSCGVTIEYVPNDVVALRRGTDIGGGPDGADGFKCPKCGKDARREMCRWNDLVKDQPSVFDQTPPFTPTCWRS